MDYYYLPASAPCRSVLMAAKILGIKFNLKLMNLEAGDQLTPEFIKMNPQHIVPTLNDHGFCIWESRAILVYLVEKYGKNSSLYPTDPQRRAIVNQRLYFDMGTLFHCFAEYCYSQIFRKQPADPEKLKKMEEAFGVLNTFLEGHKYVAGDTLTIADLALVASVSTAELLKEFDLNKYPNVAKWFKMCKETVPGYDLNQAGIEEFKKYLK